MSGTLESYYYITNILILNRSEMKTFSLDHMVAWRQELQQPTSLQRGEPTHSLSFPLSTYPTCKAAQLQPVTLLKTLGFQLRRIIGRLKGLWRMVSRAESEYTVSQIFGYLHS